MPKRTVKFSDNKTARSVGVVGGIAVVTGVVLGGVAFAAPAFSATPHERQATHQQLLRHQIGHHTDGMPIAR